MSASFTIMGICGACRWPCVRPSLSERPSAYARRTLSSSLSWRLALCCSVVWSRRLTPLGWSGKGPPAGSSVAPRRWTTRGFDPLGGTWGHAPPLREGHPLRPAPPHREPRVGRLGPVSVWPSRSLGRGVGPSAASSSGGGLALAASHVGGTCSPPVHRSWGCAEHWVASYLSPRRE